MAEQKEDQMKPSNVKDGGPEGTPDKAKATTTSQQFKLLLLVMMVVQNSSTVLVGRHTRSSVAKEDLYSVNHLILTCEMLKVCLLVDDMNIILVASH